MTTRVLSTADLARMVRQIIANEDKETFETQDPRLAYTDIYRVPWQGTEIHYDLGLERGVVNCPVCGVMSGMGYLSLSGNGVEVELRYEDLHVLEVHAGRVGGELVVDIERLRQVLGVADLPLEDRVDKRLQDVLMALWEIQNSVLSQYYQYSHDLSNKRREGYLTNWRGRSIRVWFSTAEGRGRPCPLCGLEVWKDTLDTSLGEGDTRVHIPAAARHLMEVHGLVENPDWKVLDQPWEYARLQSFLGIPK
jgi:hypothetical protein